MASPKNEYFVENERTEVAEEATETKNGKQTSNASKLRQMGASMTSVFGQLTSLSLGGSSFVSSPPLSPASEIPIQGPLCDDEFKSLLHKALYTRNAKLHRNIRSNVNENYTKVPLKLSNLSQSLDLTQSIFAETVMTLQKANHHCSETFWTMDDSLIIANTIRFPNP